MNNLPDKLSRKAVIKIFDQLSPTKWEKLFEREDGNGLAKLRGEGDFPGRAYYETAGLIQWLVRNGYYMPEQNVSKIDRAPRAMPSVRTHILAG